MAQIVVERSAIADFLDELPGLLMQYKQMQWAMEERALEREERKASTAQQILLKEYYDKKAEVRTTEKVFDQYDNLKPSDISSSGGGADLISIVDNQNNINMDAVTQNLNTLGTYQSELESSLGELRGQAQTLKEMQMDFAGANRVLEPHEYQAFQEHALQALEEGGLGWSTTAGADVEYYKTDPEARFARALNVTEKMKSDEDTGAKGNYAIIQSIYTVGKGEDAGDLVDRLTYQDASGKEIEPSEEVIAAIQRLALQPNYDEFVANLNALPAEYGGDAIRTELMTNPNTSTIFGNLQSNVQAINILDNELAGINELDSQTKLGQFVSDISGVTNQQALFGMFDQAVQGLNPEDHEQFFNAMELQTGSDLEKSYGEYKGFASGINNSLDNSLNQLAMTSMTGEELFPGQLETQYRGMEYQMAYTYPELSEGITKEEHIRHQMKSVIGAQVGLDIEIFGNESRIVDTKLDKDGRIMVKIDPDADALIGVHPPRWKYKGKPIYLDELNIVSLGRAQEAMPTAFEAGPIGYYWDPMSEEYRIKRNQ